MRRLGIYQHRQCRHHTTLRENGMCKINEASCQLQLEARCFVIGSCTGAVEQQFLQLGRVHSAQPFKYKSILPTLQLRLRKDNNLHIVKEKVAEEMW